MALQAEASFGHVVQELDRLGVGYVTLLDPNEKDAKKGVQIEHVVETLGPLTSRPIIVNTGFDKAKGEAAIAGGTVELVAFGVPYIANPDLVERFRTDAQLNKPDPATFYGEGPKGYTDYPTLAESGAAA